MSQTNTWQNGGVDTNWDTPGNWSLGRIPNSTDDVSIVASSSVSLPANGASVAVTINSLAMDGSYPSSFGYASTIDLHNVMIANATNMTSINPIGGNYQGAITITSGANFTAGNYAPVFASTTPITVTDASIVYMCGAIQAAYYGPTSTLIFLNVPGASSVVLASITVAKLIAPFPCVRWYGTGNYVITVSDTAYIDGLKQGSARSSLVLTSTCKSFFLGPITTLLFNVTDNRSGGNISASDVANAVLAAQSTTLGPVISAAQLTPAQIQTAIFGASGQTMVQNPDGSITATVVGYSGGASPQEQIFGQQDVIFGNDGNGNGYVRLASPDSELLTTGTAQAGSQNTITLQSTTTIPNFVGCIVDVTSGTGAGNAPRYIQKYIPSTKIATVFPNWDVTPDATSVYRVRSTTSMLPSKFLP